MTDEIWKRNEVDSPCVKVCVIHPDAKLCMGCYRTNVEIAAWGRMSDEERVALKTELPARASLIKGSRRGGRRGRK